MRFVAKILVLALMALVVPLAPAASAAAPIDLPDPVPCPGCWHPDLETSWQWQLGGTIDTSIDVQMYDIDGDTPKAIVDELHDDGRYVVCYISAGSVERYRSDADRFPKRVVGEKLDGWPGERWLDIRRRTVLKRIMEDRVANCATKGFDAVEFDNVDAWSNRSGFPLSRNDQLRYNVMLANLAHTAGVSAVLKNDVEQTQKLLPYFDIALNEECFNYNECDRLQPFIDAGKPVFHVEYEMKAVDFCPEANAINFNSLKKKWELGVWRVACR